MEKENIIKEISQKTAKPFADSDIWLFMHKNSTIKRYYFYRSIFYDCI